MTVIKTDIPLVTIDPTAHHTNVVPWPANVILLRTIWNIPNRDYSVLTISPREIIEQRPVSVVIDSIPAISWTNDDFAQPPV